LSWIGLFYGTWLPGGRDARICITARKAAACIETAKELSQYGECTAIPGDSSSLAGIQELAATLAEREESIDVLVNNAGAFVTGQMIPVDGGTTLVS